MPKKAFVSFWLVDEDIAVILSVTSTGIWQCPSCHLFPKNWISRAGHLTLLLFMEKNSFQKYLNYFLTFLKGFSCCVTPYNDVINILQVFWSFTPF